MSVFGMDNGTLAFLSGSFLFIAERGTRGRAPLSLSRSRASLSVTLERDKGTLASLDIDATFCARLIIILGATVGIAIWVHDWVGAKLTEGVGIVVVVVAVSETSSLTKVSNLTSARNPHLLFTSSIVGLTAVCIVSIFLGALPRHHQSSLVLNTSSTLSCCLFRPCHGAEKYTHKGKNK